jgi:hypothetical protein
MHLIVSANCKKQPKTRTLCCYQILRIWLVGDLKLFYFKYFILFSHIYFQLKNLKSLVIFIYLFIFISRFFS